MSDTKRVWEMIDAIDICMFVTKRGDDMHGRPMSTIGREEDGRIYLLTDKSAVKDDEVEDDPMFIWDFRAVLSTYRSMAQPSSRMIER